MMGRQTVDQRQLFYLFNLEDRIPDHHLLRRINPIVMQIVTDLRNQLEPFYSKFLMSGLATNGPRGPITSGETSGLRLTTTRLPS